MNNYIYILYYETRQVTEEHAKNTIFIGLKTINVLAWFIVFNSYGIDFNVIAFLLV